MLPAKRPSLAILFVLLLGSGCSPNPKAPGIGAQLFQSPQVNAIAYGEGKLVVANTTSGTISIYHANGVATDAAGALLGEVRVGVDPVGIAIRPRAAASDPLIALVTNHISDSISVVDLGKPGVVQTLQAFGPDGVTTSDAPTGVVFAGPGRAFVALDDRDEILVIDFDAMGKASIHPERLPITAQAPRAMAVVGDRLLVGAFESGNQTEFPNCHPLEIRPDDAPDAFFPPAMVRGLSPGDPHDEGCLFYNRFIDTLFATILPNGALDIDIDFGLIVDFAAQNPNVGGEVIFDRDRPDRDVLIFDVNALGLPVQVMEGVSTLLYGFASRGERVWITSTESRNDLDGLDDLDNRMFENRLSHFECSPACGLPTHVNLDQNPHGVPVPTPYGVQASGNGQQLVVSVAGSDGLPGLAEDPAVDIPGLVTLDAAGNVLGHVQTGAIPQGVALESDAAGNASTAYVLNTVDSTVSVVDVSDPANPVVLNTFPVGNDPVSPEIRLGRTMFMSARASTKGTFSCESCHPNGNTDQLIWTINSVESPADLDHECNPLEDPCPEPRTTQPVRGLRDTLPLHWLGNLADPFEDPTEIDSDGNVVKTTLDQPEDAGAPDCDLLVDGEVGCARHLVDAAISGVMCDQTGGCAAGPSGLPGALTDAERNGMAAFLMAVSYPPSPRRRPDDALSATAMQGIQDFFTDEDGLGVGSASSDLGAAVGFAPVTCGDNSGGCHALPLGVLTNSETVGNFDAPTMRGIWDRHVQFSNGSPSSEEVLVASQQCADGVFVGQHHPLLGDFLTGDPCAIDSPFIALFLGFALDPLPAPSGFEIYDPAKGITERGVFLSTFETLFELAYGTRGVAQWEYFSEMGVGFSGLFGRQVTANADEVGDPTVLAAIAELLAAADQGRVGLVATYLGNREYRYDATDGRWHLVVLPSGKKKTTNGIPTDRLLQQVVDWKQVVTITAHLKEGVTIGGADRQPLLDVDPDERAAEEVGDLLAIPRPSPAGGDSFRLGAQYVHPDAQVLVDGEICAPCSFVLGAGPNGPHMDLTLAVPLPLGTTVLQVMNPDGWTSNEMPIVVAEPEA